MFIEPDARITEVARRQFGVFTRAQALAAGHTAKTIKYRLQTGRWIELHPAVYAISGTQGGWKQEQMALCLWAKGLSAGRAAGHLFELPGCDSPPLEILTTPAHRVMARCGVVVHLTKRLPEAQCVRVEGIPSTSIDRTIMDLCGILGPRRAAIAMDNALFRGLTSIGGLDHCLYLTARRGRNGCGVMRKLLRKRLNLKTAPNSPLETLIFEMFADSSLPMPELQYVILDGNGSFVARPDFVYPEERMAIEGHSKLWHDGDQATEEDAARDLKLRRAEYLPVYLSWADVTLHKGRTIQMIERLREERRHMLRSERPHLARS